MKEEGRYSEDEAPEDRYEAEEERDTQRRLSSLIAASHRSARTPADRRRSAEKASELHQQLVGYPLEIDNEGRVIVGESVMK